MGLLNADKKRRCEFSAAYTELLLCGMRSHQPCLVSRFQEVACRTLYAEKVWLFFVIARKLYYFCKS